jgi:hypothetical protein
MRRTGLALLSVLLLAKVAAAGEPIYVPTDPQVEYTALSIEQRSDGLVEIVTRRVSWAETSYAKRLVDCDNALFTYLGDGSSLETMEQGYHVSKMAPLVEGSISYFVSLHACSRR